MMKAVAILFFERDDDFWIEIESDGTHFLTLGPFATIEERERAHEVLMRELHSMGAKDMPLFAQ